MQTGQNLVGLRQQALEFVLRQLAQLLDTMARSGIAYAT